MKKSYKMPTVEFIELLPEERLARTSGENANSPYSHYGKYSFWVDPNDYVDGKYQVYYQDFAPGQNGSGKKNLYGGGKFFDAWSWEAEKLTSAFKKFVGL